MSESDNVCRMRQYVRVARLALHLLQGVLVIAFVYPFIGGGRRLWLAPCTTLVR